MANGLRHIMTNFGHILSFVWAKELLQPMRPHVDVLQGHLAGVYLKWNRLVARTHVRKRPNSFKTSGIYWSTSVYLQYGSGIGITPPTDSVAQYCKRTVAILFLDIIGTELKPRFRKEKQAHYQPCALIPTVIVTKSKKAMAEHGKVLQQKGDHVMRLSWTFESDLFRWTNYWKQQAKSDEVSVTCFIERHMLIACSFLISENF